ncbi:Rho GTPase [Balamuthia mandrillaris]
MNDLSDEVLLLVFCRFDEPKDLAACSLVSLRWRQLAKDNLLWKAMFQRRWPALLPPSAAFPVAAAAASSLGFCSDDDRLTISYNQLYRHEWQLQQHYENVRKLREEQQRKLAHYQVFYSFSDIKCVVVGDTAVGKTCLLSKMACNQFIYEHCPTLEDSYSMVVRSRDGGHHINLRFCDTSGAEVDRLLQQQPSSTSEFFGAPSSSSSSASTLFAGADVIIVCFSVVDEQSFHRLQHRWLPALQQRHLCVPLLIVGTKLDLRPPFLSSSCTNAREHDENVDQSGSSSSFISYEMGSKLVANCWERYAECSSKTGKGISAMFQQLLSLALKDEDVQVENPFAAFFCSSSSSSSSSSVGSYSPGDSDDEEDKWEYEQDDDGQW